MSFKDFLAFFSGLSAKTLAVTAALLLTGFIALATVLIVSEMDKLSDMRSDVKELKTSVKVVIPQSISTGLKMLADSTTGAINRTNAVLLNHISQTSEDKQEITNAINLLLLNEARNEKKKSLWNDTIQLAFY